MDEQAAADAFKQFGDQSGLAALIEEYIWIAVVGFALLFLRDAINNLLAGLALSVGSDYSESGGAVDGFDGTARVLGEVWLENLSGSTGLAYLAVGT